MPAPRTHYQILNVAPDAEPVVIEAAYRALMKKYHPDHSAPAGAGGPSAAEINRAFSTLRDAERRADYDRREWTKAQDIMLAPYQAPPSQRVSRVFGWGGWIVASILGGMFFMLAGQANEAALQRAEVARAAAAAEPDMRSQPSLPDEPLRPPPPPALADASAGAAAPLPLESAAPEAAASEAVQASPPAPARKVVRPKPRPAQAQARRPRTAAEKDFLEREGYIY
jgi:hypothetical protein